MANDYYDFNPSATTWALLLTGFVLFVVALCVLLIYVIDRSEAHSIGRPHLEGRTAVRPAAREEATVGQTTKPAAARWSAATHRHA